jgi:hypothetical protein
VAAAPEALSTFASRLREAGFVLDLWVAGSLSGGDYVPGISDLDLVAIVDGPIGDEQRLALIALHRELDRGDADGLDLGCVYVEQRLANDADVRHPTWTHGALVSRVLSGVTRAELDRHGYAVFGRPPKAVLDAVTDADVREAARAEICGYWAQAARRPWWWLSPVIADLGLTGMARGRHSLATGQLLTKSDGIEQAHAPGWLVEQLRARRRGEPVVSPRLRTGWIAWRDARRTVKLARRR